MATGRGAASKAAYKREAIVYNETTWPAAAPVEVTALLPFLSEGVDQALAREPDNTLDGNGAMTSSDIITKESAGTVSLRARYGGMEFLYYAALGFMAKRIGATVMPEDLGGTAYRHLIEFDHCLANATWQAGDGFKAGDESPTLTSGQQKVRRGTLAFNKQVSVWEFLSAMVNRLVIRGNQSGVTIDADFVAYSRDLASAVNTTGIFDALSSSNEANVLFTDLIVRMDDYSVGVSLGAGDVIGISEFEITIDNQLAATDHSTNTGFFIEQPERGAKVAITGSFTFPRYVNDTFMAKYEADTVMMADLKFTGGQIAASGENYQLNIYLPSLTFDTIVVPIGGAGLLGVTHTFTAYQPAGAASGFPTNNRNGPIMIEVQSTESNHLLL